MCSINIMYIIIYAKPLENNHIIDFTYKKGYTETINEKLIGRLA